VQIERTYYGVISDAIEGCFAFDIDSDAYAVETALAKSVSYSNALNMAVGMEEKIMKFYSVAGEMSRALITDVARAFDKIARKRGERIDRLRAMAAEKVG